MIDWSIVRLTLRTDWTIVVIRLAKILPPLRPFARRQIDATRAALNTEEEAILREWPRLQFPERDVNDLKP